MLGTLAVLALANAHSPGVARAHDDDPRIEADVERAAPGAPLTVRGYEFPYEDVVDLSLRATDGTVVPLGSVTADVEGSFVRAVRLPVDLATGTYEVSASDGHHDVGGPQVVVAGQPLIADDGDGQRQEDDGLLAPMPTYAPAPAVAPAVVTPQPAFVNTRGVDSVDVFGWPALVVAIVFGTAGMFATGAHLRRRATGASRPVRAPDTRLTDGGGRRRSGATTR